MNIKTQILFRVNGLICWQKEIKIFGFVGDDDQSIYSWRGAEIKIFLEFDQIYENTKVIRLEQNYRSSQNILSVASNLISNNQNRVENIGYHDGGRRFSQIKLL